jgi:hypothetical protein
MAHGRRVRLKKTLFTGQNGELNKAAMAESMWGFRELIITDEYIQSNYITPENRLFINDKEVIHSYAKQDSITISLK